MNVAVIGSGIAGLAAAYHLSGLAAVTLYEAQDRLGGHTDTHDIETADGVLAIDSGFIVFNEPNYPGFTAWLKTLGVGSQPSDMSFSVSCPRTGLEYGTDSAGALFCQPRNALSPRFLGMLLDVRRFYRDAPAVLHAGDHRSLRSYLEDNGYGAGLAELHLAPMCGALWSQDAESALDLPIAHVVAFMAHHRMLELRNRPAWRVVQGGSRSYVEAFERRFPGRIHTGEPVQAVRRQGGLVRVTTPNRVQWYDAVVVCTHSDQALGLLDDASALERTLLGSIRYRDNVAVVHSDPAAMPTNRRAWSSWNARTGGSACSVTYWMNRLQSLSPGAENYFVTLNPEFEPQSVHAVCRYAHPVFDQAALTAQRRLDALNGCRNTYFAGAYWGWGFHEDGYQSAMTALRAFQRRQVHAA